MKRATVPDPGPGPGPRKKARRLDGRRPNSKDVNPFARFDLNVRALCYDLNRVSKHVIFAALGVIDLIVEYARPVVPLFAPVPDVLLAQMAAGDDGSRYDPQVMIDVPWRFKRPYCLADNIPVGSLFSCPELGRSEANDKVDCIVVVSGKDCLPTRQPKLASSSSWIVGVIIPVVTKVDPPPTNPGQRSCASARSQSFAFGADRTIFTEHITRQRAAEWKPEVPPAGGMYAVHYVDVHCLHRTYWDPLSNCFRMALPSYESRKVPAVYEPNPTWSLFPHHALSSDEQRRIHMLPLECSYSDVEAGRLS